MIRAIVRKNSLELLDPFPPGYCEGSEVRIDLLPGRDADDDVSHKTVRSVLVSINEKTRDAADQDYEHLMKVIEEQRRIGKQVMARKMGLAE